jgi:hypothetical protein
MTATAYAARTGKQRWQVQLHPAGKPPRLS